MNRSIICLLAIVVPLAGCGGTGAMAPSGSMAVRVTWPEPSRLLPAASKSVVVTVKDGATTVASKVIPRPATGGTTTVVLDKLPVKMLSDQIVAYPNPDGTGIAQATGSATVQIETDTTVDVKVTLVSTITRLQTGTYSSISLEVAKTFTPSVEPRDQNNNLVLVKPGSFHWRASDPAIAGVAADGTITAVKVGVATITVIEPESGKETSIAVTVTPADPVPFGSVRIRYKDRVRTFDRILANQIPTSTGWRPIILDSIHAVGSERVAIYMSFGDQVQVGQTIDLVPRTATNYFNAIIRDNPAGVNGSYVATSGKLTVTKVSFNYLAFTVNASLQDQNDAGNTVDLTAEGWIYLETPFR